MVSQREKTRVGQQNKGNGKLVTQKMNGAQIAVEVLKANGVDTIFGIQGGQIMPFFDQLYMDGEIRIISMAQEGAAGHAAEGYSESTGKLGVLVSTSGPGATNCVTPVYDARMDSIPILAITGQVPSTMLGTDAFQEAPTAVLSMSITKHSSQAQSPKDVEPMLTELIQIALSGRTGPVALDFCRDAQVGETRYPTCERISYERKTNGKIHSGQLERALKAIQEAKRPVIYAGGGIKLSNASGELYQFAVENGIPVITTLKAKGVFPERHALSYGMAGMHGSAYANRALYGSDLIIALGTRLDDRVIQNLDRFQETTLIQVDLDDSEINKRLQTSIPITGDVKRFLEAANENLRVGDYGEWVEILEEERRRNPFAYERREDCIMPQYVIETLDTLIEGADVIITTGVGQHQMWAAQYMHMEEPRRFLTSGGLGTMGYGLPAAIGAKIGNPSMTVIDIDGDGSFNMNIQELRTLHTYGINIKTVILHNGTLGMVRNWQHLFHDGREAAVSIGDETYPDFTRIASGYGIEGRRISEYQDVVPALNEMLSSSGPYVLDIMVENDLVFPMIKPGGTIEDMRVR